VEGRKWKVEGRKWKVSEVRSLLLRRGVACAAGAGDHVIQLTPLCGWRAAAVRAAPFIDARAIGRATLGDPAIPDNLDARIVGERARQQLEGGEVTAANDDELRSTHVRPFS